MDAATGVVLNPNFETYKLPGAADIPDIDIVLQDMPERRCHRNRGTGNHPNGGSDCECRFECYRKTSEPLADFSRPDSWFVW